MIRLLVIALLLSGCDSCLPASFRATPKAGFERMAVARLRSCVENNLCQYTPQCFRESELFCLDAGYSKTCGQGEIEGSCAAGLKRGAGESR